MPIAFSNYSSVKARANHSSKCIYFHLEPEFTLQVAEDVLVHRLIATINLWQDTIGLPTGSPEKTKFQVHSTVCDYFNGLLQLHCFGTHHGRDPPRSTTHSVLEQALHEEWRDVMASLKLEGRVACSGSIEKEIEFRQTDMTVYVRQLLSNIHKEPDSK